MDTEQLKNFFLKAWVWESFFPALAEVIIKIVGSRNKTKQGKQSVTTCWRLERVRHGLPLIASSIFVRWREEDVGYNCYQHLSSRERVTRYEVWSGFDCVYTFLNCHITAKFKGSELNISLRIFSVRIRSCNKNIFCSTALWLLSYIGYGVWCCSIHLSHHFSPSLAKMFQLIL